jgi:hypothetical protein
MSTLNKLSSYAQQKAVEEARRIIATMVHVDVIAYDRRGRELKRKRYSVKPNDVIQYKKIVVGVHYLHVVAYDKDENELYISSYPMQLGDMLEYIVPSPEDVHLVT